MTELAIRFLNGAYVLRVYDGPITRYPMIFFLA